MAGIGELERLTDEESADLISRAERFRAAWQADGTTALEWFLPPRGARHRYAVLVHLILIDMERRAPARLPFEVESYLTAYSQDISAKTVPVAVLITEYSLRLRNGDKPALEEYRRRFPAQHAELAREVSRLSPSGTPGAREFTPVTDVKPVAEKPSKGPRKSTVANNRQHGLASPLPPPAPPHFGELQGTGPVNFLETPTPGEGSTILPTDTPYQLLRKIGSGAFGEVFEALAPGGVRVAVKRITRSADHPACKAERSALDAIKELSHPFLLKTNAYWTFNDRLVIVMELADGSLADRIEHHISQGRNGVPPEALIPILEQAGEALDYLHSQNVSHRDIKPENILILKGYAKVADFGLARIHEHTMTTVNNTVGTPAYMAPEMWKQRVSLQSDQYSLAATYVRARLNRNLFTTNVLVDLANFHINETPNLDPLPAAEQKVLLKALAKDPDDRYRSCVEFARALRAAVMPAPEPVAARPIQPGTRFGALLPVVLVALACALVVGAVNYFTRKTEEPQPPPDPNVGKKDDGKPPVVVAEKNYAIYPTGWKPSEKDGAVLLVDKYYHKKLTRKVGDRELAAYLIYWDSAIRPEPYYMFEHKVTNKVFNEVWQRVSSDPKVSALFESHQDWKSEEWRKEEDSGRALAVDGDDADLPVLGVRVPHAMVVAEGLGGSLPTFRQWQKATGVLEDDPETGPAGRVLKIPERFNKPLSEEERTEFAKWKEMQFKERKLALGRRNRNPLPVTSEEAAGDVSRWKIRQLVSNGQEWLCQAQSQTLGGTPYRITLSPPPDGEVPTLFVGYAPYEGRIDSVGDLVNLKARTLPWLTVDGHYAGFRVVLEPR